MPETSRETYSLEKEKGYVEDANFDFMHRFYIDSEEYGLHPKTSHPRFTEHFTEELYYDCVDEEAPFGSDEEVIR